ncbi:MAG: hypothetical protein H6849_02075 [Alphaproteobacteria bacterium]|nr:MAG: hypothetical protein H6849_02075 [Alphaproteobacteria bacterium]
MERPSIRAAVKTCEHLVSDHCKRHTCREYCSATYANTHRNKIEQIASCLESCPYACSAMGHAKDPYANRQSNFDVLEAQTREVTMRCIAELRDPDGTVSGRPTGHWKDALTPRYRELLRGAGMLRAEREAANEGSYSSHTGIGTGRGPAPAALAPAPSGFRMQQAELDTARARLRSTGRRLQ